MWDRTLEFLAAGGPVMLPLFAAAVLAFGLLFERWRFFRAAGDPSTDRWLAALPTTTAATATPPPAIATLPAGLLSEFIRATVAAPDWAGADRPATLRRHEIEFRERLERGQLVLGMLAGLAPLLGLLGTVTGMISTFQIMASSGVTDSRGLSLGIAEALITTEVGLAIALLTLVGRRYLLARAEQFRQSLKQLAAAAMAAPHGEQAHA